jgi:hypothetical protein
MGFASLGLMAETRIGTNYIRRNVIVASGEIVQHAHRTSSVSTPTEAAAFGAFSNNVMVFHFFFRGLP